jgi:hypothetical protein
MKNVIKIWKSKGQILEGIKNNIFKVDHIEEIAQERLKFCEGCILYDGKCAVKGTGPCCGDCGCSLKLKVRALSAQCPLEVPRWKAVLTFEEEYMLQQKLREEDGGN